MSRTPLAILALVLAASAPAGAELQDLYFGEALYHAHQGEFFSALQRLDSELLQHRGIDEPQLDSLYAHLAEAEFSVGDFELRYRMHHRAGRAIRRVLEGAVDERIRNDAAYRLASIHFQKGQAEEALHALDRIAGEVPQHLRDDIDFLRANVLLALQHPERAIELLKPLQSSRDYGGFAAYNLAIAYQQEGRFDAALAQLERAGETRGRVAGDLAIRDKANLVLGSLLLEQGQFDRAAQTLDRVRLDGPFSNQALLKAGWANLSAGKFERAIVPLDILAGREVSDAATQEGMLALPFAYSQLDVFGRASVSYKHALDSFGAEIARLNASIESIRAGKFLDALVREEIRRDRDWVVKLREMPGTPETYYLMQLMASHDFQTGLQNYLDLTDLRRRLRVWKTDFGAFGEMVHIRHGHYQPLLPDVDEKFRQLDSRLRLRSEQHRRLVKRRDELLTMPRPEFLATRDEQSTLNRLTQLRESLQIAVDGSDDAAADLLARSERLSGIVLWAIHTEYHERLTEFDANLRRLEQAMAHVQQQYDRYVRARQAATHSYTGYDEPLQLLGVRVDAALTKIDALVARQGRLLELVAIDELIARRTRIEGYREKARFALADSYDRATHSQARAEQP